MVQVLPYVPGVIERLAPYLQQAGTDLGQGLQKRNAQNALQQFLIPRDDKGNPIQSAASKTPMDRVSDGIKASPPQQGKSYLDKIRENPSLQNVLGIQQKFEEASPGSGKFVGEYLLGERKVQAKEESALRIKNSERQIQAVQDIQKRDLGRAETLQKENNDLRLGLQSVRSGEVGGFDINYLANSLGPLGEPLKTAKGAQLQSVSKNLLLDGIQKISGNRPNQWVEQQLQGAIPNVGKTAEANETLFTMGLAANLVEQKLIEERQNLISKYDEMGKIPPTNIEQQALKNVKPYAENVEKVRDYKLREIYEKEKGQKSLKSLENVPRGTPLTRERAAVLTEKSGGDREKAKKTAEKLGYTIYPAEIAEEAEQRW